MTVIHTIRPKRPEAIDELEVVERIYRCIKTSDLDCADWEPEAQKLLAYEIASEMFDLIETRILRSAN